MCIIQCILGINRAKTGNQKSMLPKIKNAFYFPHITFSYHVLLCCQYRASVCPLQMGIDRIIIVFQCIVGNDACVPMSKQKHRDENRFRLLHADS